MYYMNKYTNETSNWIHKEKKNKKDIEQQYLNKTYGQEKD